MLWLPLLLASLVHGGGPACAGKLRPGLPAPDFALQDLVGREHQLSELRGRVVVLEWTSHLCPRWRGGPSRARWTSAFRAPLGVSVAIEHGLAPGLYALTVRADGSQEWSDTVALEPCLETRREIMLQSAEQGW